MIIRNGTLERLDQRAPAWPEGPTAADGVFPEGRGPILLVAPQPFYQDRGTPIAVRQLIEALADLGYPVDVVTYPIGRSLPLDGVRFFRAPNIFGIRQVPIGLSGRKVVLDAMLFPTFVSRLYSRRYAAIHAVEEAAFMAAVAGPLRGVPVVYDMQSSIPEQLARHGLLGKAPAQAALHRAERWLLSRVDVVVGSAGLAQHVARIAPETRFREWRFAGTPPRVSREEVRELRRALRIEDGAPVVVYSGTFASYQGLAELVAAIPLVLRQLPSVVFVLVGAEGAEGERIVRLTRDLARRGHIRVLQRQRRELVPAYLAMADVLVSARAYGGNLPLKVFDYLAAGRPIVATDVPAHRAMLDSTRAELVEPTPPALALAIVRLLSDPERAAALAAEARRYARVKLGWIEFLRSVSELYAEVTARHRSEPFLA
jgi:glycosyltransferase involved in cell wall biosynthesis